MMRTPKYFSRSFVLQNLKVSLIYTLILVATLLEKINSSFFLTNLSVGAIVEKLKTRINHLHLLQGSFRKKDQVIYERQMRGPFFAI